MCDVFGFWLHLGFLTIVGLALLIAALGVGITTEAIRRACGNTPKSEDGSASEPEAKRSRPVRGPG